MGEIVWGSHAMKDTSLTKALTSELLEEDPKSALKNIELNEAGSSLESSEFPKTLFPQDREPHVIKRLPQLFDGAGQIVVSEKAANILRQFDLGRGGLHPVRVLQKDMKTEFGGGWHCIHFGNVKEAFVLEESMVDRTYQNMKEGPQVRNERGEYVPKYYELPFVAKDNVVAVSKAALEGPDIWVEPLIYRAFFVSDRLAQALKRAKLDKAFRLFKCRMV